MARLRPRSLCLLRWHVVRLRHRHNRWRFDTPGVHEVCEIRRTSQHVQELIPSRREYGLDHMSKAAKADLSANIASTLQAGCFFGALIASYIADRLGRRTGLMIAAAVTIVGVVMQSAASGSIPCMVGDKVPALLGIVC